MVRERSWALSRERLQVFYLLIVRGTVKGECTPPHPDIAFRALGKPGSACKIDESEEFASGPLSPSPRQSAERAKPLCQKPKRNPMLIQPARVGPGWWRLPLQYFC